MSIAVWQRARRRGKDAFSANDAGLNPALVVVDCLLLGWRCALYLVRAWTLRDDKRQRLLRGVAAAYEIASQNRSCPAAACSARDGNSSTHLNLLVYEPESSVDLFKAR